MSSPVKPQPLLGCPGIYLFVGVPGYGLGKYEALLDWFVCMRMTGYFLGKCVTLLDWYVLMRVTGYVLGKCVTLLD